MFTDSEKAVYKKVKKRYMYQVRGRVMDEKLGDKDWSPFLYHLWFNEKGKKVKETLEADQKYTKLKERIRTNIINDSIIHLKSDEIKVAYKLDAAKEEEIFFEKELFGKYNVRNDCHLLFSVKHLEGSQFMVTFSKIFPPKIRCYLENRNSPFGSDLQTLLSDDTRNMIFKKMISHSKEKVKLITEGYDLDYKKINEG